MAKPAQVAPSQPPRKVYQWFTVVKLGDNDCRVVSAQAPLPDNAIHSQQIVIPEEIYDRWLAETEPMISQAVEDFR